jgi:hypothetical protein
MKKLFLIATPLVLLSGQEVVQEDVLVQTRDVRQRQTKADAEPSLTTVTKHNAVHFIAADMVNSSVVKNSPYSAEAVTETVQTLADGNRITRKNTVVQYRDSEGRTRREFEIQSIGRIGDVEAGKSVSIDDPVSKTHYSLDLKNKTAFKTPSGSFTIALPPGGAVPGLPAAMIGGAMSAPSMVVNRSFERMPAPAGVAVGGAVAGVAVADAPVSGPTMAGTVSYASTATWTAAAGPGNAKEESLGSRNIEGVEAKGTRSTWVIPAGEVGNEREMSVVSERWYSEQLKTFVMTRHSDPRFGETTLKLTNVRLSEPPASMFEVPADFTMQEAPAPMQLMRKRIAEREKE